MDEALARARAYADAGADAVLIHSKEQRTSASCARFADALGPPHVRSSPCRPPTPTVGPDELAAAGFRMAIFANQALRAAIVAMRDVLARDARDGPRVRVEDRIVPLEEVYRLVGVPELKANEERFLFARRRRRRGRSSSPPASSRSCCRSPRTVRRRCST